MVGYRLVAEHDGPVAISVFDLFSVGIGPSSSHTVGPMRAARTFAEGLADDGLLSDVVRVRAELFGSLGATGRGHGSDRAVILGLEGERPETVDTATVLDRVAAVRAAGRITLLGKHEAALATDDLVLHRRTSLPFHPNGMRFFAYSDAGEVLRERSYYSIGGGFVVDEEAAGADRIKPDDTALRYPFTTGDALLAHCAESGLPISGVMLANETAWRSEDDVRAGLLEIWSVMQQCVQNGWSHEGILPGGLKVRRRAPELYQRLCAEQYSTDPLRVMDWVNLFALAVNEENAAGGRVVTAPTNGAAGILPAVLHYYVRFVPGASDDSVVRFLLTAAAIGVLYKENASISGAEVGCQGEVGFGVLDGRRRVVRGAGRHAPAGRERGGDRDGAQPRPHLRSDRRLGPGAVHRAQCHGRGEGDQRGADRASGRRPTYRQPGQGDQDDAGYRRGYEIQVQGDLARRTGRQRHRVLMLFLGFDPAIVAFRGP